MRSIDKILDSYNVPPFKNKAEMLDLLLKYEYGYIPAPPEKVEFAEEADIIENFCAGKAQLNKVECTVTLFGEKFTFPFYVSLPTKSGPHPFFVHINFRPNVPDRYMPTEELIDKGFAVLSFCYEDVTSDDDDFTNGLAGIVYNGNIRGSCHSGKIAMWAWAASRVLDFAEANPQNFDMTASVVCGHSRLGKTALLAGAIDERFMFSYSNDSGSSGAALARASTGETVKDITDTFPYWFAKNYKKFADKEKTMPFDQHFLIKCITPRFVLIGSAENNSWASPQAEFLSCVACGKDFVCEDRMPKAKDRFFKGKVGYHMRAGEHYFSREDWDALIEFVKFHKNISL